MISQIFKKTLIGILAKLSKAACLSIIIMSFAIESNAQATAGNGTTPPPVTIAGTQLLHIRSSITNKDYDLYVSLPQGYADTTKSFPVLFLLDAQWDFPLVHAIYGEQYFDGFLPQIIIVGITWGGKNPNYDQLRAHDLTPTDMGGSGASGNAPQFLSFIKRELIPYIEKEFRVKKNDRTLVGSSLGGLFSLYALFQEPGVFNRYVFTSPAIGWDQKMVYSLNKNFAEKNKELAAKVFIGIGEYEDVPGFQEFVNEIKAKNYKNLELETKVLLGMGHSGGKAEGYTRGLQWVFARPSVKVAPEKLSQYQGDYSVGQQYKVTLLKEQEKLALILPDKSKLFLNAESDVDFYMPGQFLNVHIEKDATGKPTGFILKQYGGSAVQFKKTN